ncbi:MAG: hypothetical protein PHO54_02305 [Candidatus Peribacteraceae bacterium]|nr:hypothetical protein [Candidatus Peribacteraceae bacterium]
MSTPDSQHSRLLVDIAETVGAPSATAVLRESHLDLPLQTSVRLRNVYQRIFSKDPRITKIAVISDPGDESVGYRIVQAKTKENDFSFECGRNCGNSMIAAALIALRDRNRHLRQEGRHVRTVNLDTSLTSELTLLSGSSPECLRTDVDIISMHGMNPSDALLKPGVPVCTVPSQDRVRIPFTALHVVNPYVIFSAAALGIRTHDELLTIERSNPAMLDTLLQLRKRVIECLSLTKNREFPKVALALCDEDRISARTVYLGAWHRGLPLTALITTAVASAIPGSVAFRQNPAMPLQIQTPQERITLRFGTNPVTGAIQQCLIPDRKAVFLGHEEFSLPADGR